MRGLVPVRDTAPLSLTLTLKPLGRRQLDSVRVVATMSGKVLVMRAARGWGKGVSLTAKKRREAKGREVAVFEGSSSCPTPKRFFFFFFFYIMRSLFLGTRSFVQR